MTFFDKGSKGTWAIHDCNPGDVRFHGVKTQDLDPYESRDIQRQWEPLNKLHMIRQTEIDGGVDANTFLVLMDYRALKTVPRAINHLMFYADITC